MPSRHRLAGPLGGLCAGLTHGALAVLAFPPVDLWWLAFVGIVPLIWASSPGVRKPRITSLMVALGCLPAWMYFMQYTASISQAGFVPLTVYLSLWPGIFVHVLRRLRRARPGWSLVPLVALAWMGVEFFRGEVLLHGFAWFLLGHPLIASEWLSAPGVLGGQYLVGGIVAAVNAVVVVRLRPMLARRGWQAPTVHRKGADRAELMVAVAIVVVYGLAVATRLSVRIEDQPVRIGVVQTNVPQSVRGTWPLEQRRNDLASFIAWSAALAAESPKPDVIVWPETMFPGDFLDAESLAAVESVRQRFPRLHEIVSEFSDGLMAAQARIGVPMIIGVSTYDGLSFARAAETGRWEEDARYNSAVVVVDGQLSDERYDKMRLAPFGEEMPYISAWPWLERQLLAFGAAGMTFDLAKGRNAKPLDIGGVAYATPICFEATISSCVRRLRGDVILNMTNDGWFGAFDAGRLHHALAARWRAVELVRPLVRVANTGVSGAYDHRGQLTASLPARTEAGEVFEVRTVAAAWRPFALTGQVVGWISLLGTTLLLVGTYIANRRTADVQRQEPTEPALASPAAHD